MRPVPVNRSMPVLSIIMRGAEQLGLRPRDSNPCRGIRSGCYAEISLVPAARILGRAVAMPDIPWLGLDGPLVGLEDVGRNDAAGESR